mmetsp:Transcript_12775/g.19575  ORF Transcript_12775/g.19575 Transcript_12775/m.19575 type:complete len:116 (-) Transcript_12775:132-479(-)
MHDYSDYGENDEEDGDDGVDPGQSWLFDLTEFPLINPPPAMMEMDGITKLRRIGSGASHSAAGRGQVCKAALASEDKDLPSSDNSFIFYRPSSSSFLHHQLKNTVESFTHHFLVV